MNNTTPVPNIFFDAQIGNLSGSAVRVYLKIVRNLLGWRDENGNVKQKDWIAHSQFEKTGLSNRSVTNGIQELLDQNLIQVTDYLNNDLTDPFQRKKAKRVYYALILENQEKTTFYNEKTKEIPPQELRSTKEISLPKYNANERIPDQIRMEQIKQEQQRKQMQRDNWL
ncbi:hypothetical protein JL193_09640 [Polaribacter batillariae]|uniref:Bacteriophage lambda Replication protein O N-terminal domain-containing protein n=1 Tax=Polaribacter batillariae TaxID=2808900 RepID=A0ABX7SSV2_9FLAO|nr:hypothetical protein [Polaribacter batillariae]QTD36420.1 hypothetical protein JL193_09640 [Polaribacter batillariae]